MDLFSASYGIYEKLHRIFFIQGIPDRQSPDRASFWEKEGLSAFLGLLGTWKETVRAKN
jgi:hypothetical protein